MINLGIHFTAAENRAYFGLWCLMKSPLLLSANLPNLPSWINATYTNPEVVALNQDALGVQARKILLDNAPLAWGVGLERCDLGVGGGVGGMLARGFLPPTDTRTWTQRPHGTIPNALLLVNDATARCLVPTGGGGSSVVLLPCNATDAAQAWVFGQGAHTVSALVHNASGEALSVGNCTLFGCVNGQKRLGYDANPVPDAAYGSADMYLAPYQPTEPCSFRGCEGYHPEQLWYFNYVDRFLEQATYTASINHVYQGEGYVLTPRTPTYAHHCLAHVLSTGNGGTPGGSVEVWAGPLTGSAWAVGLFNPNGAPNSTITVPFSSFEAPGVGAATAFCVRDIWSRVNLGVFTGSFSAVVDTHDLGVFKLTPGACQG